MIETPAPAGTHSQGTGDASRCGVSSSAIGEIFERIWRRAAAQARLVVGHAALRAGEAADGRHLADHALDALVEGGHRQRMLCVPQDHPFASARLLDPELLAQERLVRLVPCSISQEWQDYHFPRHTPQGKPIGDGPLVRTIREALAAVVARQGLVMLIKRASSYCATPQIAVVEIDLPDMPSTLMWRADDPRPILREIDALLLRIARRYGIAPDCAAGTGRTCAAPADLNGCRSSPRFPRFPASHPDRGPRPGSTGSSASAARR